MNKKRVMKYLGIIAIIKGFIILLIAFVGITGFVVAEDLSGTAGSFLGIVLIIGGFLLLNVVKRTIYQQLGDIEREYSDGKISPVRAAIEARNALLHEGREITGVKYKGSGKNVTIITPQGGYTMGTNNHDNAAELALGLYEIAVANNPANERNCELHLSKRASTKDHRDGFKQVEQQFRGKHSKELSSVRR